MYNELLLLCDVNVAAEKVRNNFLSGATQDQTLLKPFLHHNEYEKIRLKLFFNTHRFFTKIESAIDSKVPSVRFCTIPFFHIVALFSTVPAT